jgi:hypothetical protein
VCKPYLASWKNCLHLYPIDHEAICSMQTKIPRGLIRRLTIRTFNHPPRVVRLLHLWRLLRAANSVQCTR